jgi:hypothetical protein
VHPRIYTLQRRSMPWGDYGNILAQGMLALQEGKRLIQLQRTGPFIPPISFPSTFATVVTAAMKTRLEKSGLTGLRFPRVNKLRIVKLRWEKWDRTRARPVRYPLGGEPENYILIAGHNTEVSREMGDLFELRPKQRVPFVECGTEIKWGSEWPILRPAFDHWRGEDFFLGQRGGSIYVTSRAKSWLSRKLGEWVQFESAKWG